jgi:putative redox protein
MTRLGLDWKGGMRFANSPGSPAIELHSSTRGVASPPEALAYAVMACMAMDVVHVLEKGRHEIEAMRITFDGERAKEHPRRFISMAIRFEITGRATPHAVERAITLSRSTYCSVWNTLRPDVHLKTSFEVHPPSSGSAKGSH